MLIDGRKVPSTACLQARVCIIGTGMGAISVAYELVKAGWDVMFIEAGPVAATRGDVPVLEVDNVGRPFRLLQSRGLEMGGGTAYWHGVCAPLDDIDFERRDWIPHSGWPIDKVDLAAHYHRAWQLLCGSDRADSCEAASAAAHQPITPSVMQPKLYQFRSSPFRAKDLLLDWCKQRRARCVTNAVVLELVSDGNGTVRRLIAGSAGRTFSVDAEIFIVAAGALETPRLLLNSQELSSPELCDGSPWVGRNLLDHPAAYLSQVVFRTQVDANLLSGMAIDTATKALPGYVIQPQLQHAHRLANHALFIRPGFSELKVPNHAVMSFLGVRGLRDLRGVHVKALLSNTYIRKRIASQRLPFSRRTCYGDLFFMTEQLPNPASRIDLSESKRDCYGYPLARIHWQLTHDEIQRFGTALELIMDSMDGHPHIRSVRKDSIDDWIDSVSSAAHHLGSARMAVSPSQGVVDVNLKVFGTNNLWVCDGSVFPTAGSVNPSLTICALGHRLATHLVTRKSRLSRPSVLSYQAGRAFGAEIL